MYLIKTPKFIQNLFPNFVWSVPTTEKKIFLTFDDGPVEKVTPWVIQTLKEFNAKGTFFCVGDNINKYPEIFDQLIESDHTIGNHTHNHLSGWATDNLPFYHNVRHCARLVKSSYFRPPYGRLKPRQVQFLLRHYKIIMWDVLSGDFDNNLSKEQCLANVLSNTKEGSIVVFHDSFKSEEKLRFVLPKMLQYFSDLGFTFEAITEEALSSRKRLKNIA